MRKILLFLLLCAGAFALEWDEAVLRGALPNGLRYYILENSVPKNSAVFYLIVDAGSIDEGPNERGLAHFIEHMSFNGSRDFSKNELIKKDFGQNLSGFSGSHDAIMINLPSTLVDESVFAKDAELKKQIEIDREKCLKGGKINDIFN